MGNFGRGELSAKLRLTSPCWGLYQPVHCAIGICVAIPVQARIWPDLLFLATPFPAVAG